MVIEGDSLVDTSPVTGEPVPVRKNYGDEITSGCINTNGMLKIRVEKVLSESMVTRILDSVENAAASKPQIDRFITRFASIYSVCGCCGNAYGACARLYYRQLAALDLHGADLSCNKLPLRTGAQRALAFFLRHRRRFALRHFV